MRNLKRALSLALAAMMLIGMMVVSAGAASKDFTDKDEITHSEAVNTLVALNVIGGKEDGSYFDPTGTLTRAEMAKLVTYVLNGGVEPVLGTKVTPTYSDIKGHWAEAYIEYCTSMNIIVGDGTGKFNPEGTLTASQCAKMLLTAMNYKDDVFGFTGNSWEINVNREANAAGLYKELGNVSASAPISRDNAAQMVYNAIQSKTMKLSWSQDMTTGQITQNYTLTGNPLFVDKFEGKIWMGTFTGNKATGNTTTEGEIEVVGKLTTAEAGTADTAADFPADLDLSNIGEQVKVLFKDGDGGSAGKPDKKDTIYGVYNTGATQIVTGIMGDVKDQKSSDAKINIGGTKYDTADTVTVVTNYGAASSDYAADNGATAKNSDLTTALKQANGNTIKAIVDPDSGDIETIYVVASKIAAVTAINSEKVSMNNGVGTIVIADNDVYSDIAKGDVVVVTTLYNTDATDDDAYTIVKKAEVVSGTVNGYKGTETVTLDGTAYTLFNKSALLNAIPNETVTTTFSDDDIGETFDLYMVNGYVGAAVQTSESASNYSLITAVNRGTAGDAFDDLKLQIVDAESTTSVITVSDDSAKVNASDYKVGDIIVYTGNASNAVVTIKSSMTADSKTYSESTKAFDGAVTTADCVLFAETTTNAAGDTGAKYKVYNIRSLDTFTASNTTTVTNSDGKVVAVFADLGGTPAGATSTTIYGIVTGANGRVKIDDSYYYRYTVASNSETYTINIPGNTVIATGDLVSFEPTSDNTYANSDLTKVTSTAVYVKEYSESDGTLTYFTAVTGSAGNYAGDPATQSTLALDDDCAIIYVDADGDVAGSEVGVNGFDSVTGYKNAVVVTKNTSDGTVITAIFVETSNKCDIL